MSSVSRAIKKVGKKVLKAVAIGAIIFATGGMAAGLASGAGAVAGASAGLAKGAGLLASGAGAVGGALKSAGGAIAAMDPLTKGALIQTGGSMLAGAMTPTAAEQAEEMHKAQMSNYQGTSGLYGGTEQAQPLIRQTPQVQQAPIMAQQSPVTPQSGSVVRFDEQAGKFVS